MVFTLELYEFKNLIMEMSEIGVANYVKMVAPKSDIISEREAFRKFGEAKVKQWVRDGNIDFKRMGSSKNSRKNYSYSQLITIAKAENLIKKGITRKK